MPTPRRRPLLHHTQRSLRSRARHSISTRLRITTPEDTGSTQPRSPNRHSPMLTMRPTHRTQHAMAPRPRRRRPRHLPWTITRLLQRLSRRTQGTHPTRPLTTTSTPQHPRGDHQGPEKTQTAGEVSRYKKGFRFFKIAQKCPSVALTTWGLTDLSKESICPFCHAPRLIATSPPT